MGAIDDPDDDDREHGAVEAPDRIEGGAVGGPGEENRHEDEHTKELHSLVADCQERQNNKAPVNQLTNGFCVDEVVKDAVQIGNVVEKSTVAVDRGLNRWRVEQHGRVEGDAEHRGDNRDPFEPSLQSLGVRTSADRPCTPWDPDHPETVSKEEKAESTNRCEWLDVATVNRSPFQTFDELLHSEEKRHQRKGLVIRSLMTRGEMM